MNHIRFLIKINNIVGYFLIATIVLSPIGFIQVLLGHILAIEIEKRSLFNQKLL